MAINFPTSPTDGDIHTAEGLQWQWDNTGSTWKCQGVTGVYTLGIASVNSLGGIKVGNNLSISSSTGVLDAVMNLNNESISELTDVTFNSITLDGSNGGGKVLAWDQSLQAFAPVDQSGGGGGGGSSTFVGLTDTPGSMGSAGKFLTVNSGGNALEFTDAPAGTLAGLTDTDLATSAPQSGDFLTYTGTNWVANPITLAGNLGDVAISSPSDGDVLTYNNSAGLWQSAAPTGGGGTSTSQTITGATLTSVSDDGLTLTTGTNADISMIGDHTWGPVYASAENKNPSVTWDFNTSSLPTGVTVDSYSVLLEDLTAPDLNGTPLVHWDVSDIPATTTTISADASAITGATINQNFNQAAVNTDGVSAVGYSGPQPPTTDNHVYRLSVTAHLTGSSTGTLTQGIEFNFDTANTLTTGGGTTVAADNLTFTYTTGGGGGGGGGGSGLTSRTTGQATATSLASSGSADLTITTAKTYALLKIQTSHAAWVTLYTSTTARTNDSSRIETADPQPGSGVIAEVITSDGATQIITPGTIGWNDDGTPSTNAYVKVVNKSGGTADVTVTLHFVQLEV